MCVAADAMQQQPLTSLPPEVTSVEHCLDEHNQAAAEPLPPPATSSVIVSNSTISLVENQEATQIFIKYMYDIVL